MFWHDSRRPISVDPLRKYVAPAMWDTWDPARLPGRRTLIQMSKPMVDKSAELISGLRDAHVRLLAGTDAGASNSYVVPGFSLHEELRLLVQAGLSPLEALQTATRNAAMVLGTLDRSGTIETGKRTDLVLLDADPLKDITNTRKIATVIVRG